MVVRARWFGLFLAVAAISVHAQNPRPPRRNQITLNVVAFDSSGHPVSDLTSADLKVTDQGKAQTIRFFRRNTEKAPVVLLFDLLNDNLGNRGYGTQAIVHALEPLESSDSVYLYLLTGEAAIKPVRALPGRGERGDPEKTPWTQHIRPLLDIAMNNVYGLRGEGLNRIDVSYAAIDALASTMSPREGRKNIIWITHGVPDAVESGALRQLATTLDKRGVTLNSVDLGSDPVTGSRVTLEQLAELTGGAVYTNDIDKAVTEVMAGGRSDYTIRYDAPQPDGKYHKVRVTTARKGIKFHVKQGYDSR
jgi:VWFA-related protein